AGVGGVRVLHGGRPDADGLRAGWCRLVEAERDPLAALIRGEAAVLQSPAGDEVAAAAVRGGVVVEPDGRAGVGRRSRVDERLGVHRVLRAGLDAANAVPAAVVRVAGALVVVRHG